LNPHPGGCRRQKANSYQLTELQDGLIIVNTRLNPHPGGCRRQKANSYQPYRLLLFRLAHMAKQTTQSAIGNYPLFFCVFHKYKIKCYKICKIQEITVKCSDLTIFCI
jgi:hypothetical protein